MNKIVGIGANVCDTLISLCAYPAEDTKLRADSVTVSGGGPCATGLAAAAKLGADCAYIGVLTDDNAGIFLKEDLEKYHVSTEYVRIKSGYTSFSSYIWLSRESASRTCVFHKGNVPPLALDEAQKRAVKNAALLMVDGNEMGAALAAARIARESGTKVLYDAGGLYDGVEELMPYADILIPSEEFALGHTGETDAQSAAKALFGKYAPEIVVITQGKAGGILYDGNEIKAYPAFQVDAADTNGSGDVFHGAFAFAVNMGYNYYKACVFSSAVSALKCTKIGARRAVPSFQETMEFLKERGINAF
ncbi:MAG: PfkB family carbohydrate kinase [Clostridia bacterium]|nr:PfkB family carbohydrate kinase [Clostridia bacterium]